MSTLQVAGEEDRMSEVGFEEEFNFNPELSKSARIEQSYGRSATFIEYLKDLASLRNVLLDEGTMEKGKDNESGELESVWQYLDHFYHFGDDGMISEGRNPLQIDLDPEKFLPVNVPKLPDLGLYGKDVVVIEFFTHCCINCIHSIEDVRHVYYDIVQSEEYRKSPVDVQIISVHSPKFTREKRLDSIKSFTEQMNMDYGSVVNDPDCCLWNELGISCWPTILILGPSPASSGLNLLFTLMGEGQRYILKLLLTTTMSYFRQKLNFDETDGIKSRNERVVPRPIPSTQLLKHPGKVAYCNGLIAVADTGNHRVIVSNTSGNIQHVIGQKQKGFADGDFSSAKFSFPQGVCFGNKNCIYVADTANHAVREIDLSLKKVTTLVNPTWNFTNETEIIHLKSPWDVSFFSQDVLLVAAAGNHRIFAYFFETTNLLGTEYNKGTLNVIAGNGKEENRNNTYILKASFAQPSGVCTGVNKAIYIADSESSSIRSIVTEGKGKVCGLAGGAKDPTDLFSYGDKDGKGTSAKLQHPMGVCFNDKDSLVYFVDTYNNKVKTIDPASQECRTFCSEEFNEPGGICFNSDDNILYVADTNNHCIKTIALPNATVTTIELRVTGPTEQKPTYNGVFWIRPQSALQQIKILITHIPENFEGAQWRLLNKNSTVSSGEMTRDSNGVGQMTLQLPPLNNSIEYCFDMVLDVFLCGPSACYKRTLTFLIQEATNSNPSNEYCQDPLTFKHETNMEHFL